MRRVLCDVRKFFVSISCSSVDWLLVLSAGASILGSTLVLAVCFVVRQYPTLVLHTRRFAQRAVPPATRAQKEERNENNETWCEISRAFSGAIPRMAEIAVNQPQQSDQ